MLSFWKTALAFAVVALTVPLFAGVLRSAHQPAQLASHSRPVAALDSSPGGQLLPRPTPVKPSPTPAPHPPASVHVAPAPVAAAPFAAAPVYQAPAPPPPPPAPRPAPPPIVVGSYQQALINSDRAGAGLRGLSWSGCLAAIAYQSAARMAAQGYISHAGAVGQAFGCGLGSAQTGENVGFWSAGVNDGQLNAMFMASAEHRANIMGPYRYVGTAWVVARNGYAYISVVFA